MVFWGVKLKPRQPLVIEADELEDRRLHLSQATLGQYAKDGERTILKCKSGDGPPVFLCSLKPGVSESCSLDLFFEDDVIFSVTGSTPVHLSGYYMEMDEGEGSDGTDDDDEYDQDFLADTAEEDDDDDEYSEEEEPLGSSVKIKELTPEEPEKAEIKGLPGITEAERADQDEEEESEDEDGFAVQKRKVVAEEGSPKKSAKTSESDTPSDAKKIKKKKLKKAANQNGSTPVPDEDGDGKVHDKKSGKKGKSAKKFPNGLEVQDVAIGKPDGKQAKPGKKVFINYIGKLKSTGKIFDSTIGKKPFHFRLGVNEVVKGFDIGVNGMRVGDKRRVTVPPSMGYGAKAVGPIPPNSWLIFELELLDVA